MRFKLIKYILGYLIIFKYSLDEVLYPNNIKYVIILFANILRVITDQSLPLSLENEITSGEIFPN